MTSMASSCPTPPGSRCVREPHPAGTPCALATLLTPPPMPRRIPALDLLSISLVAHPPTGGCARLSPERSHCPNCGAGYVGLAAAASPPRSRPRLSLAEQILASDSTAGPVGHTPMRFAVLVLFVLLAVAAAAAMYVVAS